MEDSPLRQAVGLAIESLIRNAPDRDAALDSAEAEIAQMLLANETDAERKALLSVVREEIAKARAFKH